MQLGEQKRLLSKNIKKKILKSACNWISNHLQVWFGSRWWAVNFMWYFCSSNYNEVFFLESDTAKVQIFAACVSKSYVCMHVCESCSLLRMCGCVNDSYLCWWWMSLDLERCVRGRGLWRSSSDTPAVSFTALRWWWIAVKMSHWNQPLLVISRPKQPQNFL